VDGADRVATAPQAAGVIHTDFEKGFIRAEIYSVADLEKSHGEGDQAKPARCGSRARTTSCTMADVCHFLFNV
jgi:ribosome-binding ATPase YchF (GTP1/OBG family)